MTEQNRTEQNRTEHGTKQNRTEQNTEQNSTSQNRTETLFTCTKICKSLYNTTMTTPTHQKLLSVCPQCCLFLYVLYVCVYV